MKHFIHSLLLAIPLIFVSLVHAGKSSGGLTPNALAKANAVTDMNEFNKNQIILKQNDKKWISKPVGIEK